MLVVLAVVAAKLVAALVEAVEIRSRNSRKSVVLIVIPVAHQENQQKIIILKLLRSEFDNRQNTYF